MEPSRWKSIPISFDLEKQVDALFSELVDRPWGKPPAHRLWEPEIDLYETADCYLIAVDLPGVPPAGVAVTIEDRQLIISGARRTASITQSAHGIRLERRQGSFLRRVLLPSRVDGEKIEQWFAEGILHIKLPKLENTNA
jgi:HSP20 family protein